MRDTQNKISIKRIIGNVVDIYQLDDVSSRITAMARWAAEAERKIGSTNSFTKVECELEVKNYRACLPPGFHHLIALKNGSDHLEVTPKDFNHFHKGTGPIKQPLEDPRFVNSEKRSVAHPGVPHVWQINFSPVFQPGDNITITVTHNNCGEVDTDTYTYLVQPADTIPDIVAAFVSQINATTNLYTAIPDSSWFQIQANTAVINIQPSTWTDSGTGTLSPQLIQQRIPPVEDPDPRAGDCEVDIKTTSSNLAERTAHNINDGIHSETPYGGDGIYGHMSEHGYSSSKYAISNDIIHFTSIREGKIGIAYMGIAIDEEGWPLIDALHEDAVTHYIMWMYDIGQKRLGKISASHVKDMEQRWYWLCGQARGDDELPTEDELQMHANFWNQLIPPPDKNLF